jgi:two-component system, OmpR family, response regulator BaeR
MKPHILIVEDSRELSQLLSAYLEQAGFRTTCLYEGAGVEKHVRKLSPDLLLLDLMLPGKDGIDICHGIRRFSRVPIIMVTARVEEQDRLTGLDIGADDYICKPFSPREVVARVKAVLRRTGSSSENEQLLQLDPERLRAIINGVEIICTVVEFELLSILVGQPGRVYSRTQLIEQIYPDQRMVSDRTVDSHVKKLRKKLSQVCETELIHSVYSAGYKYEELH